ncbi:MAG: cytochrome c biogenesis protein ResB [Desulfobulbaceae bacterium]|nr:cytochrome c biogenesis protein ResB [Desulfobulbaceae bacterium]
MNRLLRFLLSPKTVVSLMGAVAVASLIPSFVPQLAAKEPAFFSLWQAQSPWQYYLIDRLQLNRVYTSLWFVCLIILIACSLACSLYYQTKAALKSAGPSRKSGWAGVRGQALSCALPKATAALATNILQVMKKRGYSHNPEEDMDKAFVFRKNSLGRWGGVIFHLGLLCIILAGLYNAALQQRGLVVLSEGETFSGKGEEWLHTEQGLLAAPFALDFSARLGSFRPLYGSSGRLKAAESELVMVNKGGQSVTRSLAINRPVHFNGIKIFLSGKYGYAADFILNERGPNPVLARILLDAPAGRGETIFHELDFPTTDYHLAINFYPDLRQPSFLPSFPGADLSISENGAPPHYGRLPLGYTVQLSHGDTLTLRRVSYWSGLIFVNSHGLPLLSLGFGLIIIGAFLLYAVPCKVVSLRVSEEENDQRLFVNGSSKRYPALFFQELQEIANELEKVLTADAIQPVSHA